MRAEGYLRFLLLPFTLPGSFGAGLEVARGMQMNKRNRDTAQSSRTPRQEFPSDTNSINGLPDETNEDWKSIWISTGTVPNSIRDMPDHRLFVRFSNGVQIRPNDTVTTGLMLTPPELLWRTEPGSLYTILLVNTDIEDSLQGGRRSPGRKFVNWMISNVPLLDLDAGNVAFPYIPSITVRHRDGKVVNDPLYGQRHLFLVYKQKINLAVETKSECYRNTVSDRLVNLDTMVQQNGLLGPVAGNFIRNIYTEFVTDTFLCSLSRCSGEPFPTSLLGVNSQSFCQP